MVQFYIGNLLDGRGIQILPDVLKGSWSETLNAAGALQCTVPLTDPTILRMRLMESATPGKSFLAAVQGDTVLQAGPIWEHEYHETSDGNQLTLFAGGMWSYFDHRLLLPVLAGRLPTDPTTDTNLVKSLQGIARYYVWQAQQETNGNVPVILPDEIAGTNERNEAGSSLAFVGPRLRELTAVENGPDIKFAPRFNTARDGFEWVMQIGTPTQPLIYGAIEPTFTLGLKESSISNLKVRNVGAGLGSRAFVAGGKISGEMLIAAATDTSLTTAGYPVLDIADRSHASVSETATLQSYADGAVLSGKRPEITISFDHQVSKQPYIAGFNVGDFGNVKVPFPHPYLQQKTYRSRLVSRSGDEVTDKVSLMFQPEVVSG